MLLPRKAGLSVDADGADHANGGLLSYELFRMADVYSFMAGGGGVAEGEGGVAVPSVLDVLSLQSQLQSHFMKHAVRLGLGDTSHPVSVQSLQSVPCHVPCMPTPQADRVRAKLHGHR